MIKTINLTGTEQAVKFAGKHTHFHVHSLGSEVLVSLAPNVERGADGVLIVQCGGAGYVHIDMPTDTVYLVGSGEVQVVGSGNAFSPFKSGAEGGGNGSVISDGGTVTGTVEYPIIELNMYGKSVQDGTPTPDVPIDIVNIGDDGNVKITSHGKNIFDFNAWKNNITYVADATYAIIDNGITVTVKSTIPTGDGRVNTGYLIDVMPGRKYTLSMDTATNQGYAVVYGNNNSDIVKLYATGTRDYLTFIVPGGVTQVRILLRFDRANETNTFSNFQLEEGSAATGYEPFQGYYTATITSGLPLCSVNGVCDELVYNADGTGKIIKRTAKLDSYNGETVTTDYISSTGGLDTGAEVVYVLATPQEIELSAAEMTLLMQLQTYSGTTYIYNDEDAEMKVKIAANATFAEMIKPVLDGFDKRIASLEAAVTAFLEG